MPQETVRDVTGVHWKGGFRSLSYAFYGNGRVAIELRSGYERFTMATVNLPDEPCPPGHVYLRTWAENEGLLEALEAAGVVERTGSYVPTGFVSAPLCRLLVGPERFRG